MNRQSAAEEFFCKRERIYKEELGESSFEDSLTLFFNLKPFLFALPARSQISLDGDGHSMPAVQHQIADTRGDLVDAMKQEINGGG